MAFSTALLLILSGSVLAANGLGALRGRTRVVLTWVFAGIAIIEALELPVNILGMHLPFETLLTGMGNAIAGQPTFSISPGTLVIVIVAAIGFFSLFLDPPATADRQKTRDTSGVAGLVTMILGGTFLLSYMFGVPFLYGTRLIPIALPTAIALTLIGSGLMTTAGPAAYPLRFFTGMSIRARLLRIFLPFILAIIIIERFLDELLSAVTPSHDALQISTSIVVFSLITGYAVIRVSRSVGDVLDNAVKKQEEAEAMLVKRNQDLAQANRELKVLDDLQVLLASIVTHSSDAILGYTLDGIITSWNAAAEKIFGYSSLSHRPSDIVPDPGGLCQ
jgi:PAS domain-containing protein